MSGQGKLYHFRWWLVTAIAILSFPLVAGWFGTRSPRPHFSFRASTVTRWTIPHRIEVELKPGETDSDLKSLESKYGISLRWRSPLHHETEIAVGSIPGNRRLHLIILDLRADPAVVDADEEHIYSVPSSKILPSEYVIDNSDVDRTAKTNRKPYQPNDPRYQEQWNFHMVHAGDAWSIATGKGATVAVIDTGVAYAHTERGFQCQDFNQTHFAPGYDFIHRDDLPSDDNGHGTHVAGTIAESTNNGLGVTGLAFNSTIMPIKALSAFGGGSSAGIAEAIRYAVDHHATVINMSLGSPLPDRLIKDACAYAYSKGVTIVCAAGNNGTDRLSYPAAYKSCVAVSAVGPSGELSFYSNYGNGLCLAAPGGDTHTGGSDGGILQNTMGDGTGLVKDDYYRFQGTSMAAPHVAATAALIQSTGIRRPEDVRSILEQSATPRLPKAKYGAGVLNAGQAVSLASRIHEDGVLRFWLIAGSLFIAFMWSTLIRGAGFRFTPQFWFVAAFGMGMVLPDWIIGYFGLSSHWLLLAHSTLVPALILASGARNSDDKKLAGYLAAGLTLHILWEILRGTVPHGIGPENLVTIPWLAVNCAVGFALYVNGVLSHDRS